MGHRNHASVNEFLVRGRNLYNPHFEFVQSYVDELLGNWAFSLSVLSAQPYISVGS
jgi:hypothetical protein